MEYETEEASQTQYECIEWWKIVEFVRSKTRLSFINVQTTWR